MRIKIDDDQVTPKQKPVAFSVMDIDGKRPPHSDYRKGMIQHFRLLHSVLVKTASTKELNKDPLNSNELIDFMIDKDGRLLLMCVLALATGKTSFDEFKKEEGYDKASLLSVYMATDLIVRAVQIHEIGPAVRCMSNMFRHAPESRCHDLLSSFRVVVSSKASIKDDARGFVGFIKACLEPEVKLQPRDFVETIQDNVNWKVTQGRQSGTVESWTVVAHVLPREEDLRRDCGLYNDEEPEKRVSRQPRKNRVRDYVEKLSPEEIAIQVFLGRDSDYEALRELNYIHKKAVMIFLRFCWASASGRRMALSRSCAFVTGACANCLRSFPPWSM